MTRTILVATGLTALAACLGQGQPAIPDLACTNEADCRSWCDYGDADACAALALVLSSSSGAIHRADAAYSRACELGHLEACVRLAERLMARGDVELAEPLLSRACDGDVGRGCTHLASLYGRGAGVPHDERTAAGYYQRGCDLGDSLACVRLGAMHELGVAVERSAAVAVRLYQSGCGLGNSTACTNAARLTL